MAIVINKENERLKRRYFSFLADAKGKDEKTVDKVAASLAAFERSTKLRSFGKFHIEQAKSFKRNLQKQVNSRTGKPLSEGTINATLLDVRAFFVWVADQPGYRSKVSYSDADYFTPSRKTRQMARAHALAKGPTIDQVRMALEAMPHSTSVEKRDRALVAFTLLTGSRVGATASLKLKHIDLAEGSVFMDAREVQTKNAKTFTTWFFPVGDDARQIFEEYVNFLLHDLRYGPADPLFPRTLVCQGDSRCFEVQGLERRPWSSPRPINEIFKSAFEKAGLPYFNPHSFRNTLARLGYEMCRGEMRALKVWSQNFAHKSMLTTYLGYGAVGLTEHAEIMKEFSSSHIQEDANRSQTELMLLLRRNLEAQENKPASAGFS